MMTIEEAANISLLATRKYGLYQSRQCFRLIEKNKDGEANLEFSVGNPCIHLSMDKNAFPVLINTRCADHIIFEYDPSNDAWSLHIVELTKSISNSTWITKLCQQYDGALLNALAIAGVLNIKLEFSRVRVYSGFRINKSADGSSPVELKALLGLPIKPSWEETPAVLPHFPGQEFQHTPIPLDKADGHGCMYLEELLN